MKVHLEKTLLASEQLIPMPVSLVDTEGSFTFNEETSIVSPASLEATARLGASTLAKSLSLTTSLAYMTADTANASQNNKIVLMLDPQLASNTEAYEIQCTPGHILITAVSEAGAWWALETIRQLTLSCGSSIPCFSCSDEPRFAWRGLLLDCSRHFFTVDFIKKLLDTMSLQHLNRFHWHLVDDQGWRIPIPDYPKLTEVGAYRTKMKQVWDNIYGDFYTLEQIKEVIDFASQRNIMVIPEIETPGHASALLAAYPELGCTGGPYAVEARWGIFDEVMCAGNDEVLVVLDKVFKTVAEIFPGPYIHIGGDECPRTRWKECPKCQKRIEEEHLKSAEELQSWMTVQVANLVKKYGKQAIGWDEVLDGTETLGLPKDVLVQSWRGLEGGITASALGHQVVMCPTTKGSGCYLDHKHLDDPEEPGYISVETVSDSYHFDPIVEGMNDEQAAMVIGGQAQCWSEKMCWSRQVEYMLFPRLCALSEALWTPKTQKDFASFERRIPALHDRLDALDINYYRGKLK